MDMKKLGTLFLRFTILIPKWLYDYRDPYCRTALIVSPIVYIRCWIRRTFHIRGSSYCYICGRYVHDFHAPDEIWKQVEPHVKNPYGGIGVVLCYDCFCEVCSKLNLPGSWKLEELKYRV